MAETPPDNGSRALRPRNAASLLLADLSGAEPRFLMGKRPSAHVFMAGRRVFPGGRVERGDAFAKGPNALPAADIERLRAELGSGASARRADAFGRCARRETTEETGIDPMALGLATPVRYLARAITPPGMPRRFDTRFFLAAIAPGTARNGANDGDGELVDVGWYRAGDQTDELHRITRFVLQLACNRLAEDPGLGETAPVPFTRVVNGKPVIVYR